MKLNNYNYKNRLKLCHYNDKWNDKLCHYNDKWNDKLCNYKLCNYNDKWNDEWQIDVDPSNDSDKWHINIKPSKGLDEWLDAELRNGEKDRTNKKCKPGAEQPTPPTLPIQPTPLAQPKEIVVQPPRSSPRRKIFA